MAAVDQFIVLRHARAGKKIRDRSKDFKRGLDRTGEEVAQQLPELITSVLTSGPDSLQPVPALRADR